jgi:ABC-type Fe3+/spermidine/putrescine transport system ATPase subunit
MVAGFIQPTSGSIRFQRDGVERDMTFVDAAARNTGMVFQSYALWPHMTVAQNVAFGLEVRKVDPTQRNERVGRALELVRMGHLADRKPMQLSGGQQQRVALARALVIEPDILLLDEPLSNLDAKLRLELRSEIRRLCKSLGITTLYVTHDQKEALSMADRIAVMNAGKIFEVGTPHSLYSRPGSRFVAEFLGETNILPVLSRQGGTVQTSVGVLEMFHVARGEVSHVSIRPEAIELSPNGSLSGRVLDVMYLGESAQLLVQSGDSQLKMTVHAPVSMPVVGDTIRYAIPSPAIVSVTPD